MVGVQNVQIVRGATRNIYAGVPPEIYIMYAAYSAHSIFQTQYARGVYDPLHSLGTFLKRILPENFL